MTVPIPPPSTPGPSGQPGFPGRAPDPSRDHHHSFDDIPSPPTAHVPIPQPTPGAVPPEGWYQDPAGSGGLRFWDGRAWTEHVTAPPSPVPGYRAPDESPRSRMVTILLCVLVGPLGVHRFYVGKVGTGILQLCTAGGFGIWWLIDLALIATGGFTDKEGRRVLRWD